MACCEGHARKGLPSAVDWSVHWAEVVRRPALSRGLLRHAFGRFLALARLEAPFDEFASALRPIRQREAIGFPHGWKALARFDIAHQTCQRLGVLVVEVRAVIAPDLPMNRNVTGENGQSVLKCFDDRQTESFRVRGENQSFGVLVGELELRVRCVIEHQQ